MIYSNREDIEPDVDTMTRGELAELVHLPYSDVADTLDEWLHSQHGIMPGNHGVGVFLDALAARGWRIERIPVSDFCSMLPASTD